MEFGTGNKTTPHNATKYIDKVYTHQRPRKEYVKIADVKIIIYSFKIGDVNRGYRFG
jgi:hypothetical protein